MWECLRESLPGKNMCIPLTQLHITSQSPAPFPLSVISTFPHLSNNSPAWLFSLRGKPLLYIHFWGRFFKWLKMTRPKVIGKSHMLLVIVFTWSESCIHICIHCEHEVTGKKWHRNSFWTGNACTSQNIRWHKKVEIKKDSTTPVKVFLYYQFSCGEDTAFKLQTKLCLPYVPKCIKQHQTHKKCKWFKSKCAISVKHLSYFKDLWKKSAKYVTKNFCVELTLMW